jgi:hypothetical protein
MRKVKELTKQELRQIVRQLQELLYLDIDERGESFWNPDKEWDISILENLADSLRKCGLVPTAVERIP